MGRRRTSGRRLTVPAPSAPPRDPFAVDYTAVKKDLRRIAILAGSLIAILVLLSFFLR